MPRQALTWRWAEKEDEHAREAAAAVVLLVTAGLMIMSVVLLFLQPLLNLFGATDQILGYASGMQEYSF